MANGTTEAIELRGFRKNSDIYVAIALIGVLSLMIIPLPAFILDLFLATNITIALSILLVCLYTQHPLDFSVFPSVLLVTTLFRLALNIASTRLILLHGSEGVEAAGAGHQGLRPVCGRGELCGRGRHLPDPGNH